MKEETAYAKGSELGSGETGIQWVAGRLVVGRPLKEASKIKNSFILRPWQSLQKQNDRI
jgi:hypothetical protein